MGIINMTLDSTDKCGRIIRSVEDFFDQPGWAKLNQDNITKYSGTIVNTETDSKRFFQTDLTHTLYVCVWHHWDGDES